MNPFVKLGLDLGPLVVFFASFYLFGIFPATGIFMVATVIAATISYTLVRRVPPLMIFSAVVVLIFGGLTLWFSDETFIKIKPTIYYTTVASILAGGLFFNRLLIKDVMEIGIHVTDEAWRTFTIRVAAFFICMAIGNEIAWRSLTFETWLWLKVWAFFPISLVFFGSQMPFLMRHEIKAPEDQQKAA